MTQLFIVGIAISDRDAQARVLVRVAEDRCDRITPGQNGEDRHLERLARVLGTTVSAVQVGDILVVALSTRGAGA